MITECKFFSSLSQKTASYSGFNFILPLPGSASAMKIRSHTHSLISKSGFATLLIPLGGLRAAAPSPPARTWTDRRPSAAGAGRSTYVVGLRALLKYWTAAFTACAALSGLAQAQPVAIGAVAPPARVDTALRGSVLASLRAASPAACLAECARVPGCTGYNFAAPGPGPVLPGSPGGQLGARVDPRAANCTLMSGALTDAQNKGVVSCRMPCTAGAATSGATPMPMPLPSTTVRDPGRLALSPPPVRPAPTTGAPVAMPPPLTALPTPVIAGTYNPPLAPPPSAAPAPAPPPRPAPAPPAVVRSGVSGYEVVPGPMIDIAPLSHTVTSAQCPAGKVALSAGYRVTAGGDAQFGIEVRGAMPDGRLATVLVRNANAFVPARGQAFAVCVSVIAGLRVLDIASGIGAGEPPQLHQLDCAASERLVGGGVMGSNDVMVGSNAPRRPTFDDPIVFGTSGLPGAPGSAGGAAPPAAPAANAAAVWRVNGVSSSAVALPGSARFSARALCAPEAAVDGWELVETAELALGARSRAEPALGCPGGKALLAAGVSQRSDNLLDMVVASMAPRANTLDWAAQIANRNTIGGSGAVRAGLSALCARRQ